MAENTGAEMAGTSEENNETELTMCDVLEQEKELEDDAKAVLGDCDDTNCTYNVGYVPRQALYACTTCTSSDADPGGVCLACSYACHEGHQLVELYTKRDFRCDCGNKRFPNNPCHLCPDKDDLNGHNAYNQNFRGVYCSCGRPYPDLTDDTLDDMIQCVVCEDWYHGCHLGNCVPDNDDYEEMICTKCMASHSFLYSYKLKFERERNICVDDDKIEPDSKKMKTENDSPAPNEPKIDISEQHDVQTEIKTEIGAVVNGVVKNEPLHLDNDSKKPVCSFKDIKVEKLKKGPGFFPDSWRLELCLCGDCKTMYEKEKCRFLTDENDTIKAYEERGKSRNGDESQYDKGMSALSQMDHVKQMEAVRGFKNMKDKLKEYFKTFVEEGRSVGVKDINEFFEGMQRNKRKIVNVPFFCR